MASDFVSISNGFNDFQRLLLPILKALLFDALFDCEELVKNNVVKNQIIELFIWKKAWYRIIQGTRFRSENEYNLKDPLFWTFYPIL